MVSSRLKDIIFKKLYSDLSRVEIIEYKGEIWFIDREEKFWYFIYYKSNGEMLWRYSFFTPFFLLFSSPPDEFTLILSSWVEEVLNCKVSSIKGMIDKLGVEVEEVLNCKVTTTEVSYEEIKYEVEEVLSYKINKTGGAFYSTTCVEEVLNNEI